jgi:hypothetical protein
VNKKTGKIVVTHVSVAMDAGLSVNPALVETRWSTVRFRG